MYKVEMSDIEKIEQYRLSLESGPPSVTLTFERMLVDEVLEMVDEGRGEVVNIAYMLYFKYMAYAEYSEESGSKYGAFMFSTMCQEALNVIDMCELY